MNFVPSNLNAASLCSAPVSFDVCCLQRRVKAVSRGLLAQRFVANHVGVKENQGATLSQAGSLRKHKETKKKENKTKAKQKNENGTKDL